MSINISDFTPSQRCLLLQKMWKEAVPFPFPPSNKRAPKLAWTAGEIMIRRGMNIDYFFGRCIKTNFSGSEISTHLYERDVYGVSVRELVDEVRSAGSWEFLRKMNDFARD